MTTTDKFGIVLPVLTDQIYTTIDGLATSFQALDDLALSGEEALDLLEVAAPAAPATGRMKLYFKDDEILYSKNSSSVEAVVSGEGNVTGTGTPADKQLVQYDGVSGKAIEPGPLLRTSVRAPGSASDTEIASEKGVSSAIVTAQTKIATMLIGGSTTTITTGIKGGFKCPITGHITAAEIESLDATSGAIAIAVWIEPYADGVPVDADEVDIFSIAASGTQSQETGLSIAVTAGDWISFNVDSVTSMKLIAIALTIEAA